MCTVHSHALQPHTCAFKAGCHKSHSLLHPPDCKILDETTAKQSAVVCPFSTSTQSHFLHDGGISGQPPQEAPGKSLENVIFSFSFLL